MTSHLNHYIAESNLTASASEAFAYHERPGALERLIPPWESVSIEHSDNSLQSGSRVILNSKLLGFTVRWVAEHTEYDPPTLFADRQVSGPFAHWEHRHEFVDHATSPAACVLRDSIGYRLPLGWLGKLGGTRMARKTIESMFAYRHRVTQDDLSLAAHHPTEPFRVAISGASGLVGGSLGSMLRLLGHSVERIVREPSNAPDATAVWSADAPMTQMEGLEAVVHLAGKSIASGRWNAKRKQEFWDSRVLKTQQLCERLAKLKTPPKVLICASATGFYGHREDEQLDEQSSCSDDFLGTLSQAWEAACQPAVDAGIRVVHARFGIILSQRDGALAKMLLPAKFLGGSTGSGNQWWSWIALDDAIGAIYHCIADQSVRGPVNFVSPQPVRNRDFAKTLGHVLGRPAIFPAPAFALRLAFGEMADALLLQSARVNPSVLQHSGYRFRFTDLDDCLRYSLGQHRLATASQ